MAVKRNLSCFFSKGIGWTGQWYESGWGSGTRGVFLLLLPRWSTMFSYEKTGDLLKLLKDCKKWQRLICYCTRSVTSSMTPLSLLLSKVSEEESPGTESLLVLHWNHQPNTFTQARSGPAMCWPPFWVCGCKREQHRHDPGPRHVGCRDPKHNWTKRNKLCQGSLGGALKQQRWWSRKGEKQ